MGPFPLELICVSLFSMEAQEKELKQSEKKHLLPNEMQQKKLLEHEKDIKGYLTIISKHFFIVNV